MYKLVTKNCLRPLQYQIRFRPTSCESRWFSSRESKELTQFNKRQEIKGYFTEDFNVKGQAIWGIKTTFISASIIYMASSAVAAFASYCVIRSSYSIFLIDHLKIMDFLSYFEIPDEVNVKNLFAFAIYGVTEPLRLYIAYRFRTSIRNTLYKYKFFKDPQYKPWNGEKSYDETKIGRF